LQDSPSIFYEAATLMLVGMVFVYAFLSILIVVIKTIIAPLGERFPDPIIEPKKTGSASPTQDHNDQSIVAAISAAVTQYRNKTQDKNK
jgi:oxaloacetate decarboxylase (Na+ extruding) subunit gamma